MKRLAAVALVALVTACGSDSPTTPSNNNQGPITFTANLSAANEVPAFTNADSNARGTATIVFNVPRDTSGNIIGGGTVNFSATVSGFPAGTSLILAHIHTGASGVAGGVLVNTGLSAASPVTVDASGNATLTFNNATIQQSAATDITNNPAGFYFNVHSQLNPNGAVRGQLVKQ